ncbi:hypothetical protein KY332_02905 [Candidatus Woesearchaeota archaeon]|nr:hypothetical protein [Candidatus Woesearchaeota archaeon]
MAKKKKTPKKAAKKHVIPKDVKGFVLTLLFAVIVLVLVVGVVRLTRLGVVGKAFEYEGTEVDLSDYPYPFVDGCDFNGAIVVGDNAPAEDVTGATDISSTLAVSGEIDGEACNVDMPPNKLASEVTDVSAQNVISVGNPCDNAISGELWGNPIDCDMGLSEGQARIKMYNLGGNIQLLVAGPTTEDTRRAARVLYNYTDFILSGEEVCVTGTTLDDMEVSAGACVVGVNPLYLADGEITEGILVDNYDAGWISLEPVTSNLGKGQADYAYFNAQGDLVGLFNIIPGKNLRVRTFEEESEFEIDIVADGRSLRIYMPSSSAELINGTVVYVADDGSTYYDTDLTQSARIAPKPECTDTDGGMDYYTKGTCVDSNAYPTGATDHCQVDEGVMHLYEMYCHSEYECHSAEGYECPNGCADGACIPTNVEDCTTVPFQDADRDGCHAGLDSDCGGIEGVNDPSPEITCFDGIDNDCDGMIDGDDDDLSCQKECTDSDDGRQYYKEGSIFGCLGTGCTVPVVDSCVDGVILEEGYCDKETMKFEEYSCPNGCEGTACVSDFAVNGCKAIELNTNVVDGQIFFDVLAGNGTEFTQFGEADTTDHIPMSDDENPTFVYDADLHGLFIVSDVLAKNTYFMEVTRINNEDGIDFKNVVTGLVWDDVKAGDIFSVGESIVEVIDYDASIENSVTIKLYDAYMNRVYTADGREILLTAGGSLPNEIYKMWVNEADGGQTVYYFEWEDGCAVIENIVSVPVPIEECTDTDGGRNYYEAGSVYTCAGDLCVIPVADSCIDGFTLQEGFCDKETMQFEEHTCPNGCENGACVGECTDSDGGLNYYGRGTVHGLELPDVWDTWTDYCGEAGEEEGKLVEYVCRTDDYGEKVLYECPQGCEYGACIDPECYVTGTLEQGETAIYIIGEKEYEVEATFIGEVEVVTIAKLKINGEVTKALEEGESYILNDGTEIKILTLIENDIPLMDVVTFCFMKAEGICTDTDDGKDYYKKGEFSGFWQGELITNTDSCVDALDETGDDVYSSDYLGEGYCENGELKVERIVCEYGCEDGACIISPEPQEFTVELDEEWNLISLPLVLEDRAVEAVFSGIEGNVRVVYAYDPLEEWKVWYPDPDVPSNLETIDPGKGYWIYMKEEDKLTVEGTVGEGDPPKPPRIDVKPGWNLIGVHSIAPRQISSALASIEGKYISLWGYGVELIKLDIEANPYLEPGKGYWIYITEEGEIIP